MLFFIPMTDKKEKKYHHKPKRKNDYKAILNSIAVN